MQGWLRHKSYLKDTFFFTVLLTRHLWISYRACTFGYRKWLGKEVEKEIKNIRSEFCSISVWNSNMFCATECRNKTYFETHLFKCEIFLICFFISTLFRSAYLKCKTSFKLRLTCTPHLECMSLHRRYSTFRH